MGITNPELVTWNAVYTLFFTAKVAYNGAQMAYNWMTTPSSQSPQWQQAITHKAVSLQDNIQKTAENALDSQERAVSIETLKQKISLPESSKEILPKADIPSQLMSTAIQSSQREPIPVLCENPSLHLSPHGSQLAIGAGEKGFPPLTGKEITLAKPIRAMDLTAKTPLSGTQTSAVTTAVQPVQRIWQNPVATNVAGAVPIIGTAVAEIGTATGATGTGGEILETSGFLPLPAGTGAAGAGATGAAGAGATGAAGTTAGSWWSFSNMYDSAGAAYENASSAASFAWGSLSWSTKLGLGVAAVGLVMYMGKKYLMGPTVYVDNRPVFNNSVNNKQGDVHLHFPEGTKVETQPTAGGGMTYTITKNDEHSKSDMKAKESFHKAVGDIMEQQRRIKNQAASAA